MLFFSRQAALECFIKLTRKPFSSGFISARPPPTYVFFFWQRKGLNQIGFKRKSCLTWRTFNRKNIYPVFFCRSQNHLNLVELAAYSYNLHEDFSIRLEISTETKSLRVDSRVMFVVFPWIPPSKDFHVFYNWSNFSSMTTLIFSGRNRWISSAVVQRFIF